MKKPVVQMEETAVLGEKEAERGRTVLELLAAAGRGPEAPCGGIGKCGRCLVRVVSGECGEPTGRELELLAPERLADGWRLACQARVKGSVTVAWESPAWRGKGFSASPRLVPLAPAVERRRVRPASAAGERRGDWERLAVAAGLDDQRPTLWACLSLAGSACGADGLDLLVKEGRMLGTAASGSLLGAAVDIGTTTVAAGLFDLESGVLLAARSAFNAQRVYGADILARLAYALQGAENRAALRDGIQDQVRTMLRDLLAAAGAEPANLAEIVIVGNTAMGHLFLGLDQGRLAVAPFVPVYQAGLTVPAAALGLPAHPGAEVFIAPNLAGFVGGDTAAGVIATDLSGRPGPSLLVDLGTNGELVLSAGGRLWACSTAAGPAFEGAAISCGMPGVTGAIERVELDGDLSVATIGGAEPLGLCGSGLLDAVAVLRTAGAVDATGRLRGHAELPPALAGRIRPGPGGSEILLAAGAHGEVVLTQQDLRQVQLAKGAIAAGVRVLCAEAGLNPAELREVLLAGAFGQYVDPVKAADLGLFPGVPPERIHAVGSAAAEGARLMLLNAGCREAAQSLVGRVTVVELAAIPGFQDIFAAEMLFP